jgi:AcrR family transcriptional regulator
LTPADGEGPLTSRTRLLNAGKTLFARNGYEQTSTAAIARSAGSSESQLIRYFGGKAGLLEAIFNESWAAINGQLAARIEGAPHGREAVVRILGMMIEAFGADHDTAFLFLFEGRRTRSGSNEVVLSSGFTQFITFFDEQILRGRTDGSLRTDLDPRVLRSAAIGCAEGMLRDRVIAERNRLDDPFDDGSVLRTCTAMVNGLAG